MAAYPIGIVQSRLPPNFTPEYAEYSVLWISESMPSDKDRLYVALYARGGRAVMPGLEDT